MATDVNDGSNAKETSETEEPESSSSWFKSKASRSLGIPVVTGLILVGAFCAYYFVYVRERSEYLINRNFRALAILGSQLQKSINVHSTILQTYADQSDQVSPLEPDRQRQAIHRFLSTKTGGTADRQARMAYLDYLAPNFELDPIAIAVAGRSQLAVRRRDGNWELVLTASGSAENHTGYAGSIKITDLLQPYIASLPFDDILVASQSGAIVYEKALAGPRFTTLSSLLGNEAADGNKPKIEQSAAADAGESSPSSDSAQAESDSTGKIRLNADQTWRARSPHLADVTLAGTKYKLFLQPVLVDSVGDRNNAPRPPREWVLCGLVSAKALQWESLAISYTAIIWLTALFLIVCFSAPVLKIFLLNQWEHLKARELSVVGLFLLLLSCVFTLAILQSVYYHFIADGTDDRLQSLATRLSGDTRTEISQMRKQLLEACSTNELRTDLAAAEHAEVVRRDPQQPIGDDPITPYGNSYPYFNTIFWTDSDGHQIVKWSSSSYVTPMIDVSVLPAYQRLNQPEQYSVLYLDGRGPPFVLDSVVPPNRLEYLAVLGTRTCLCNPSLCRQPSNLRGDVLKGDAFIAAEPFSLIDPLLPYGFGFAVIDRFGRVLFHADKTRNTLENFWQESDWNQQLYAAIFGHSSEQCITLTYMGKSYRARVIPIDGLAQANWSLVVYRDLTFVRTLNLQTTAMAATLFLIILTAPLVIVVIWRGSCRPHFVAEWLWPHAGRTATYIYQTALYGLLIVLLLCIAAFSSSEEAMAACVLIPYTALAFTFWAIRLFPSGTPEPYQRNRAETVVAAFLTGVAVCGFVWLLVAQWQYLHALAWLLPIWLVATLPLRQSNGARLLRRYKARFSKPYESKGEQQDPGDLASRYVGWYAWSVLLLLLLIGILTPLVLFRDSLRIEARLLIKEAQLHLAASAERQQALLRSQCDAEQRSLAECREFAMIPWTPRTDRQVSPPPWSRTQLLPLYKDDARRPDFLPHSDIESTELYSPWFQRLIYLLHHNYNQPAAEMSGVISDRGVPKGARFKSGSEEQPAGEAGAAPEWSWWETNSKITLRKHGSEPQVYTSGDPAARREKDMDLVLETPFRPSAARDTWIEIGVALIALFLICGLFLAIARRVFLFQIVPHRISGARQAAEAIRQGRNVVILLPPQSNWRLDTPTYRFDVREHATTPKWAELLDLNATIPVNTLVEIRGFESPDDPENHNQKFVLLDRLRARPGTQIAVVMVVGPSIEDYRRQFAGFEVIDFREEPLLWLAAYAGPARDQLWKECAPVPALWPLGAQLAAELRREPDLQHDRTYTNADIAAEVLEKAELYYRLVWNECSPLQKFVLSQLATDGALNPTNARTIQQLVRRGLIVKDPQFRIVNESFRRFLASVPSQHLRREWLQESRKTGWGKAHGAFFTVMVVVGLFLLTTQNGLWNSAAAYVTTALGALATLTKLFNTFKGTATAGKES